METLYVEGARGRQENLLGMRSALCAIVQHGYVLSGLRIGWLGESIMKCEHCGSEFEPRRRNQKYCSEKCNKKAYYARHREAMHLYQAEYRAGHREEIRLYQKEYWKKNCEALLLKKKNRYRMLGSAKK